MDTDGELVTERFDYDGGREVTVSVPSRTPEAIVYAGDGQTIAPWGADLEGAEVVPTMVVGVHRIDSPDEMARIREYSPQFDEQVFSAHEQFFVDEVQDWVRSRFGLRFAPERTAVCGVSASAELALIMGLRHPDRFGVVFGASPGGGARPPAELPSHYPRTYLLGGTEEPWFLENATRWADALRGAGTDVIMAERPGEHGGDFWRHEFPIMVKWAFGERTRDRHQAPAS